MNRDEIFLCGFEKKLFGKRDGQIKVFVTSYDAIRYIISRVYSNSLADCKSKFVHTIDCLLFFASKCSIYTEEKRRCLSFTLESGSRGLFKNAEPH